MGDSGVFTPIGDKFHHSANVVGYVTVDAPPLLTRLVANPLNGGRNRNNGLNNILPLPASADGALVQKYTAGWKASVYDGSDGEWRPFVTVDPGEGFFFKNPTAQSPLTLTFVGEVPEGTLSNAIPAGWSALSSMVPQPGLLGSNGVAGTLQFPLAPNDVVGLWKLFQTSLVEEDAV